MFSVSILRRLQPCVVSLSLRSTVVTAAQLGPPYRGDFTGRVSLTQLHAVRRSFLGTNNQVQSLYSPSRCLCVSEDERLVYTGSLSTAVRGVKLFSYSTSTVSLLIVPQMLLKTGLGVQSLALQVAFCSIIGCFTFLIPVLLHFFTKGYVIRLYHNEKQDTYTAITWSVFLREKRKVFLQSQVKIPDVSQMFTTFYADKTGLLVNPDSFAFPSDYNHLMGYDKPFLFDADDLDNPDWGQKDEPHNDPGLKK